MIRFYVGNNTVERLLEDWYSLLRLAKKQVSVKKGFTRKTVWELLERSSPRKLNSYRGNEFIVVRILFNKVDKKYYVDLRIFELIGQKMKATTKGVSLPVENWGDIKQCLNQMQRKYDNEE